jgi:hypothetical protein
MQDLIKVLVFLSVFIFLYGCSETRADKKVTHIQNLISQNKIKISLAYGSIEKIVLKVDNRRLSPFRIIIPVGTILSFNDRNYQNMLCYEEVVLKINPFVSEKELEIPVVCINMLKKYPKTIWR